MRILHAFDLFSPYGGGTVDLIHKLARALTQQGHEITIYTSDYKLDREYLASLPQVKVYPFHLWLTLPGLYLTPGIIAEAKKRLSDFEIIHLHCFRSFQNMVLHHYARKYGVPYVVDAHGSTPRTVMGKRGFKWLLRWLFDLIFGYRILRDAARVIAETEVGVNEYRRFGVPPEKIVLIPPPFDVAAFSRLPAPERFRQKYGLEGKKIVMFLGRIHWIKGLDFLVESFYQLTKRRNDTVLAIVGNDDGYKPALDKLIERLDLSDRVLFTGFLSGEEKLAALVDADVVVQTSRYEQGAWAPFEAILCNTPIIVSDNSGAGEDVRRIDAGYLVEYGNKVGLSDMIQYVLDKPAEAQGKTQRAKHYIETNLSMAKGIEHYEKLYREILEGCKK